MLLLINLSYHCIFFSLYSKCFFDMTIYFTVPEFTSRIDTWIRYNKILFVANRMIMKCIIPEMDYDQNIRYFR